MLDPYQTTTLHRIGAEALQQRTTALPGRSLPDVVNTQPGWLLEANGILHPRGSEYQTQFVVDGLGIGDEGHTDDAAIVNAVLALAHSLGLNVTAEGIETPEQLSRLRALGCTSAQGYYLSRPLPAADLCAWLRRHRADADSRPTRHAA